MCGSLKLGVVGLLALQSFATADVLEYQVIKSRYFSQTSVVAPTVAHAYEFAAELDMDAGDAATADVNGLSLTQIDPEYFEYLVNFPNQAAMDAAFPAGTTYDLQIQGGALGTRDETLLLPTPGVFPSIPALTPASYLALQAADATQPLLLQWTAPLNATHLVGVEIYNPVTDNGLFELGPVLAQTSVVIPSGTLQQGVSYQFVLYFANANFFNGQPAEFGVTAEGVTAFVSELEITFQPSAPVPCVDLVSYELVKFRNYEQTADAVQPVTPTDYSFSACIESGAPGSFGTTSLLVNGLLPGQPLSNPYPAEWDLEEDYFGPTAKADMDAVYPSPGTYTLGGGAGTLGIRSQTVLLGADAYPPIPVVTATGYSDLQDHDPSQSLPLQWASATGSTNRIFIEVLDVLADDCILEADLPAGVSNFVLPPNLLQAGRVYELIIIFGNLNSGVGALCPGFGAGSEELTAFATGTTIRFRGKEEFPSTCNGDGGDQRGCTDCPCNNNAPHGTVGGCLNSAGTATRIAASGDPSASTLPGVATDLRFTLSGAPAGAFCVMLSGSGVAPLNMNNLCFGLDSGVQSADRDGLRCAVMNVKRHGGRSADSLGEVIASSGPNRVWGGEAQPHGGLWKQGGFSAGQTRYFQVTFRENPLAGCMRGLNTSQAVEVLFTP